VVYYIYIVECADKTLYTGIAIDVAKRIEEHNGMGLGAKYTKSRQPVVLRYTEESASRSDALRREYELKQLTREKKLALIAG
jgi:putative endonuclease